jgi:uncharacterized protein (DUF924 family)
MARKARVADQRIERILNFWFGSPDPTYPADYRDAWFQRSDAFDAEIRSNFADDVELALGGELDAMAQTPAGALALLLLLDQFPRNLFRGTPRAFAGDKPARKIADAAIASGFDQEMTPRHRVFLYLPFEHSEDLEDQERSVSLFATLDDPKAYDYAVRHRDVISRFGRFPHRNVALGRQSTEEEVEFLKTPGSSF